MKFPCGLLAAVLAAPCLAQAPAETLLRGLPAGYRIEREQASGDTLTSRMLPEGQTEDDWTELVTTHVFVGRKGTDPERFQLAMAVAWLGICEDGTAARVMHGRENGYAFSLWSQTCPHNPATGRPEATWTKAIEGNDSFYLVQKSFRADPTDAQVSAALAYFGAVTVCDPRLPDRQCPAPPAAQR